MVATDPSKTSSELLDVRLPTSGSEPTSATMFLDAEACGVRYGFSARHWYRLVDAGRAPSPLRFGRLVRWSIRALESWEADGCPSMRKGQR